MDIYKCPKLISLFTFDFFFHTFLKKEQKIYEKYAVYTEIINVYMIPYMVTNISVLFLYFKETFADI